jgi:hypothetical protein
MNNLGKNPYMFIENPGQEAKASGSDFFSADAGKYKESSTQGKSSRQRPLCPRAKSQ